MSRADDDALRALADRLWDDLVEHRSSPSDLSGEELDNALDALTAEAEAAVLGDLRRHRQQQQQAHLPQAQQQQQQQQHHHHHHHHHQHHQHHHHHNNHNHNHEGGEGKDARGEDTLSADLEKLLERLLEQADSHEQPQAPNGIPADRPARLRRWLTVTSPCHANAPATCNHCMDGSGSGDALESGSDVDIHCRECGYMCLTCDERVHGDHPLHQRSLLTEDGAIPLKPRETGQVIDGATYIGAVTGLRCLPHNVDCPSCGYRRWRHARASSGRPDLIFVDLSGRWTLDKVDYECDVCELVELGSDPATHITATTFPGSGDYVFDLAATELLGRHLRYTMPRAAAYAIVKSLERMGDDRGTSDTIINYDQFRHASEELRHIHTAVSQVVGQEPGECLICHERGNYLILMTDGLMKLYRAKTHADTEKRPYLDGFKASDRICVPYEDVISDLDMRYPGGWGKGEVS